jgi:hypothetical protein
MAGTGLPTRKRCRDLFVRRASGDSLVISRLDPIGDVTLARSNEKRLDLRCIHRA